MLARDGALGIGELQLVVDEGVVEADGFGIVLGVAIADAAHTGPVEGTEAHGTGLARAIDGATRELEGAQPSAGVADSCDLGMGRGVGIGHYAVGTCGDDLAVAHDDCTEGTATGVDIIHRKVDGHLHEAGIIGRIVEGLLKLLFHGGDVLVNAMRGSFCFYNGEII